MTAPTDTPTPTPEPKNTGVLFFVDLANADSLITAGGAEYIDTLTKELEDQLADFVMTTLPDYLPGVESTGIVNIGALALNEQEDYEEPTIVARIVVGLAGQYADEDLNKIRDAILDLDEDHKLRQWPNIRYGRLQQDDYERQRQAIIAFRDSVREERKTAAAKAQQQTPATSTTPQQDATQSQEEPPTAQSTASAFSLPPTDSGSDIPGMDVPAAETPTE